MPQEVHALSLPLVTEVMTPAVWPLCLWFVHAVPDENPPLVSDTFHLASLPLVSDTFHLASLPLVSDTFHLASLTLTLVSDAFRPASLCLWFVCARMKPTSLALVSDTLSVPACTNQRQRGQVAAVACGCPPFGPFLDPRERACLALL